MTNSVSVYFFVLGGDVFYTFLSRLFNVFKVPQLSRFFIVFHMFVYAFYGLREGEWGQLGWYWVGCATQSQRALTDDHVSDDLSCVFSLLQRLF